jgi:hypothetical protein
MEFSGPSSKLILFDAFLDHPTLTLDGIKLRGIHLETRTWFVHAGFASLTNFRQDFVEKDADTVLFTGYHIAVGKYGTLSPGFQWIQASSRYVSGKSGVMGTLQYVYSSSGKLQFQADAAVNHGVALGSRMEYNANNQHLDFRIRSVPAQFTGLAMSPARGFQAEGSWSRELSRKLSLNLSGSRNLYTRFDGGRDSNTNWTGRLQWHLARFTVSSGMAGARMTRQNAATLNSVALPISISFDSHHFGNSFQYQFTRNGVTENGAHWLRNSTRVAFKSLTVNAYAGRQTQAPTVDYVLGNVPWLRQAILSAGAAVSTPEDIQQFLATHGDLISAGYLRNFRIDVSPVHRYAGASVSWSAPHNRASFRLESRVDDDQRVNDRLVSTNHTGTLSLRVVRHTEVWLAGSLFTTRTSVSANQAPVFQIGLRRQLGGVPDILNRFQENGHIHGVVFFDDAKLGSPTPATRGIEGVVVVLDDVRKTRTNRLGQYSFGFVPDGVHTVEVQYTGIDPFVFTSSPRVETPVNSVVNFGIAEQKSRIIGAVRNDAGMPMRAVVVRITGASTWQGKSSDQGSFTAELPVPGVYSVSLDPESLPPSYSLNGRLNDQVDVKRGQVSELQFVIHALRSVSGHVACNGGPVVASSMEMFMDGKKLGAVFDPSGDYTLRDLPAGNHELLLKTASMQLRKVVDVSTEPVSMRGIDFDLCPATARQQH